MSLGDFDSGAVIYGKFTTFNPSTGAPFTLGGTPALSVYKDNSTTQTTTGVTLTADFDSVTGLNHFAIDTSDSFYAVGSFFDVVITTGTVNAVSAVGSVVGRFTIRTTACLKPTTSGRTVQVTASNHVAAVLHDSQPGSIHANTFDAGAIDAAALATDAANEIADALLDRADAIETGLTLRGAIRLDTAALAGKLSGAAGTTVTIRNVGDTKARITATVDGDGNRSAVTTDAT